MKKRVKMEKRAGIELLDISSKADYNTNHDQITGKKKG